MLSVDLDLPSGKTTVASGVTNVWSDNATYYPPSAATAPPGTPAREYHYVEFGAAPRRYFRIAAYNAAGQGPISRRSSAAHPLADQLASTARRTPERARPTRTNLAYCPRVPGKRAETLLEMMLFIEMFTLNRAWDGLTDDELMWEPTEGAWSIRPVAECRTPTPFVTDEMAADFDVSVVGNQAIEPLTSIAWLFWHVGSMPGRAAELDFFGGAHTAASGWTSPYIAAHPMFTTADDAVTAMRTGWRALDTALHSATDDELERPTRFWGYPDGPMGTGAQITASILNEVSHHATQMGVIRDFYQVRAAN